MLEAEEKCVNRQVAGHLPLISLINEWAPPPHRDLRKNYSALNYTFRNQEHSKC